MDLNQYGIMFLGPLAIFLVACRKERIRRWGYLIGFISQPFWFYAAITTEQWGILIVAITTTISWIKGIWNFFIHPSIDNGTTGQSNSSL